MCLIYSLADVKEINIPKTLTKNIKKLLEVLHSVHTRILNIIITEHDFE